MLKIWKGKFKGWLKGASTTAEENHRDLQHSHGLENSPEQVIEKKALNTQCLFLETPITRVLVDDDELTHLAWDMEAESRNLEIQRYKSPDEMLKDIDLFDTTTTFFLDYDMNAQLNGIDLARIIKKILGAKVILCTGHDPEMFSEQLNSGVIDRISGKDFIAHEY